MHLEKPRGQMSESLMTAAFIILSGGLQDAYTYLCRGKVFANAQTGNIVLLSVNLIDGKFGKAVIVDVLNRFLESYDPADDSGTWFDKIKAITTAIGFTTDMKAYKADPAAFPGTVTDVSTFIRLAVTGQTSSPDLYTVMQILGPDRTAQRIRSAIGSLN